MSALEIITLLFLSVQEIFSPVAQHALGGLSKVGNTQYFDIQAHRGGRGNAVENTLPSFAWALIDGATTLELDNGVTKDGIVVVWHDEEITAKKCQDTVPAFANDPDYPYVGKYIANLTFAQLKTLDCGSKLQANYPLQLTYPGTQISTLQEVFDFVECADPQHQILWNIESKVNATQPNMTASVEEFVDRQYAVFAGSNYKNAITYQSFDWRTLIEMKKRDPSIITSALVDDETAYEPDSSNSTSPWLGGVSLDAFPGPSFGERVAQAAAYIEADILSPAAESYLMPSGADPAWEGFVWFSTAEMYAEAQRLGLKVKPWTVNRLGIVEKIVEWGADGIITDYPSVVRRWAQQQGLSVAPQYAKERVMACLAEHSKRSREQHY